uniref:Butyrophilin subfamily 1 member A1-like n=1 Tax=Erpetoichthys calabaricus TaxID=27687 RepID=A0A8C4XEJ9_ERPCA
MIAHTGQNLFILLLFHGMYFSCAERISIVGPSHSVVSYVGEDVILPASLSPALNAEGFEVRWFKTDFSSPLLLYAHYRIINHIDTRAQLFQEELKAGNVSLVVKNISVSDEGNYTCSVASEQWKEQIQITLSVEVLGAQPSISTSSTEGQKTQLECSSEKWNPQPEVTWRDMNGADVTSQSTIKSERDSEGLLRVSSVLPMNEEYNVFSCLMRSKAPKEEWLSELNVYSYSKGLSGWLVAFCILVALCVTVTALMIFQWRRQTDIISVYDSKVQCLFHVWCLHKEIVMAQRVTNAADVTFDPETANPYLIVSEDRKEVRYGDTQQAVTDKPKRFDPSLGVLGREGFTSGRHYWEVEVGEKTMWKLGVTKESVNRKKDIILSPNEGLWIVWLRNGNEYSAVTGPAVHLTLRVKPQTVGVFLDYDEGQVSFYNAQSHSHLYTFTDSFTEPLYPYFSPEDKDGGKNVAPLVIHHLCTH